MNKLIVVILLFACCLCYGDRRRAQYAQKQAAGGGGSNPTNQWITGFTTSTAGNGFAGVNGPTFTTGPSNITITALGLTNDGNYFTSHQITLWSNDCTTALVQLTLDPTTLGTGWVFTNLATPFVLKASTSYYLTTVLGFDQVWLNKTPTVTGVASVSDSIFDGGATCQSSGYSAGNCDIVNFRYTY